MSSNALISHLHSRSLTQALFTHSVVEFQGNVHRPSTHTGRFRLQSGATGCYNSYVDGNECRASTQLLHLWISDFRTRGSSNTAHIASIIVVGRRRGRRQPGVSPDSDQSGCSESNLAKKCLPSYTLQHSMKDQWDGKDLLTPTIGDGAGRGLARYQVFTQLSQGSSAAGAKEQGSNWSALVIITIALVTSGTRLLAQSGSKLHDVLNRRSRKSRVLSSGRSLLTHGQPFG
ncbi:hypothetical protein FHL15_004745 [Xylaria flabelliformis]|uniref:Uncharacterized protein n=1 Tax=Xylaria flabelliformis TaxID=2512241 RepID=A0A553I253_9PEZI|nr:hypothetical protein FHL15_004745 [Xylaria flabelliformis]